jgi:hypothetical protein
MQVGTIEFQLIRNNFLYLFTSKYKGKFFILRIIFLQNIIGSSVNLVKSKLHLLFNKQKKIKLLFTYHGKNQFPWPATIAKFA